MAEPNSTVAGALAGAIGVVPPAMLLGAQVDALVVGMMAALFVSIMTEAINNRLKAGAAVMFSSLAAGLFSPSAAHWVVVNYPVLSTEPDHDVLRLGMALLIGAVTPSLVPLTIRLLNRKGDAL